MNIPSSVISCIDGTSALSPTLTRQESADQLTQVAFNNVRNQFATWGHNPSDRMLQALLEVLQTLSDIAFGTAQDRYFLSSLDPGVGKSTCIVEWLKLFVQDPSLKNEGAIVCLDRYEEIRRFVDDAQLPDALYGVYVTNCKEVEDLNTAGLGRENVTSARILFTTKAQIEIRTGHGRPFAELKDLFYRGRPRRVRIWDESLLVGKPLTLECSDIGKLFTAFKRHQLSEGSSSLYGMVRQLYFDLDGQPDGQIYRIPELNVNLNQVLSMVSNEPQEIQSIAETLHIMSGRVVTVSQRGGSVLVDCMEQLPPDFTPCLVTDASGRIRETYRLQEQERKNLVRLSTASKDYSNATFHAWRHPSGKGAYQKPDQFGEIAEEVTKVVESKPDEEFLIVSFKPQGRYGEDDLKKGVLSRVQKAHQEHLHFITWGRHTATNSYSSVPNVILASLLHYSPAAYIALGRAAAGRTTGQGPFTVQEETAVRKGEVAHNILQAVCRGRIRVSEGDACPKCDIWLITPPYTGVEAMLPTIFPGCQTTVWKTTLQQELMGKAKLAFDYLLKRLDEDARVPMKAVRQHVESTPAHFKRDVADNPVFQKHIAEAGIELLKESKEKVFVRVLPSEDLTSNTRLEP